MGLVLKAHHQLRKKIFAAQADPKLPERQASVPADIRGQRRPRHQVKIFSSTLAEVHRQDVQRAGL